VSRTAPWSGYERCLVHTENGAVDVRVADVQEIRIEAELHARGATPAQAEANLEQLQLVAEADAGEPGVFHVELEIPESLRHASAGGHLKILLPQACAAEVDTGNGDIDAAGLKGLVVLETSNGSIRADDVDGELRAESSNGAIVVRNVSGDCRLDTSNGVIEIDGATGNVDAGTSNGGIRVDVAPPRTGQVTLNSSNGSIDATLPASLSADVVLDTSNGLVQADFGRVPVDRLRHGKTRLTARVNGGEGGRVVAETSNGSVVLRFRE
jgi:hypothetical protein